MNAKQQNAVALDDPELLARLDALAARTRQSRARIVADALEGYLDWQEDFAARVQDGLAAAERGDFADAEEVERVFGKYRPA